jgi:hypothetical protein
MKMKLILKYFLAMMLFCPWFITSSGQGKLSINDQGYFEMPGLDVMVFDDYYPSGHQSGVTIIQNGVRVAANGDIRGDARLRQFSELVNKKADKAAGTIQAFMNIPQLPFKYSVQVKASGDKIIVTADLAQPLPVEMSGKAWFQIELFPAILFGKSWNMDGETGVFPTDSYSPMSGTTVKPYATGKVLVVAPESENQRFTIKALKGNLELFDGRTDGKAAWFVVRTTIPAEQTKGAVEWEISAATLPGYVYKPVIHISQVGYHPGEPKKAVIESDKVITVNGNIDVLKINPDGTKTKVFSGAAVPWGKFLKYNYSTLDFTSLKDPGIYEIQYENIKSNIFRIGSDIYDRYVWQPTLEYFLPVQMCHMRVEQGTRVWHDWCHLDDALMAPTDLIHFDGYKQGHETFTDFKHPEHVPHLDHGGWHDAGDYDLRLESQAVTTWRLSMMHELFGIDLDATTVDQQKRITTIHRPDGISDAIQQVEHGVLTILGGYKGLGRFYRGMINPTRKQYGLMGDGSAQTDNLIYSRDLPVDGRTAYQSSVMDDNWVFTEDNARHEFTGVATLASAARTLKDYRPEMADECLKAAEDIFIISSGKPMVSSRVAAAAELYLTTHNKKYLDDIVAQKDFILAHMKDAAWAVGMVYNDITDPAFRKEMDKAVKVLADELEKLTASTPFGVPFKPDVWGDGWTIQSDGVEYYFLFKGFPGVFSPNRIHNALQFVLGCHPGSNTASFASGVGVNSLTAAYGVNRADLSYIPGGVASGTAIIRPDFPELKENWSFLWQQTEYVMGGGETDYMFLVLAAQHILQNNKLTLSK